MLDIIFYERFRKKTVQKAGGKCDRNTNHTVNLFVIFNGGGYL